MLIRLVLFMLITSISNLKCGLNQIPQRLFLVPFCPELANVLHERPEFATIFVQGLKKGMPTQPMYNNEIEETRATLIKDLQNCAQRS